MAVDILIIGLGQIGASFGLALETHKDTINRIGYDKDHQTAKKAKKIGAVDSTVTWLQEAIGKANVILLAIPADQNRTMMETVLPGMRTDAVLLDTAPIKAQSATWVEEFLPKDCSYVGLTPAINAEYLHSREMGIDAARADLFEKGTMAINAFPETNADAIKLATDLIHLFGSVPLFTDMTEIDGLMASIHLTPQLLGAALLDSVVDQAGWLDAQRMAGRAFASTTGSFVHLGEPDAIASIAINNTEATLRTLDDIIKSLQGFQALIVTGDEDAFSEHLQQLRKGHDKWLLDRQDAAYGVELEPIPKRSMAKELMGNLFGTSRRDKSKDK